MTDDPFRYLIIKEQAGALGITGERLERALAALRAFEAEHPSHDTPALKAEHSALEDAAADRLYAYIVQREALGLAHHEGAMAHYGIPRRLLSLMGRQKPVN